LATTSIAQTYETLFKACYSGGQPDQVIASCSVLIGRRLAVGEDLATAFENRGNAYDDKGDHVRAMADFGQALAGRTFPGSAVSGCGAVAAWMPAAKVIAPRRGRGPGVEARPGRAAR
jgi:hypothetical protein